MKIFVIILCAFLALTTAQNCDKKGQSQRRNLALGTCNMNSSLPCRDPCSGVSISGAQNCTVSYCCLNSDNVCVLRQLPVDVTDSQNVNVTDFQNVNVTVLEQRLAAVTNRSKNIDAKGFNLGQPGLFCSKFPFSCQLLFAPQGSGSLGTHSSLNSPVNVPYCQRIACSSQNPFLENNAQACISQPGCYFDQELYAYRSLIGQAILPGVPVCHLAIRNRAFQKRASEAVRQIGPWNPLLTSCLINEYRDEIFGNFVGCQFLDYLEFFGHTPKRAGWAGITERECNLIGGCWRNSASESYCAYPAVSNGQPIINSSNDNSNNFRRSAEIYGLPSCSPFRASASGTEFLSSYHTCLASGCAVNVDRETVWANLVTAGSKLKFPYNLDYISMVYSGKARPDNYKTIIDKIKNRPKFQFSLHHQGLPNIPNIGLGSIIPFVFPRNVTDSRSLQFPFVTTGSLGPPSPIVPIGGNAFPRIPSNIKIPGLPQVPNVPGLGSLNPYNPIFSVPPVLQNPCPYQAQQLVYQGLPKLTGSFAGCCDQPLCYIPKSNLHNTYSGISSYLYQWSTWSECSDTCGGGLKNRTRVCVGDNCGKNVLLLQTQTCNEHQCPYYMNWGAWSECSASCGGGIKTRSRTCQGIGCQGSASESAHCRTGKCPTFEYGQWSSCSNTCGRGIRTRPIVCTHPGGYTCPTNTVDQEPCEQFCGISKVECNLSTCCYEESCLQANGRQGYCDRTYNPLVGHRCRLGACLYRFNVMCRRSNFGLQNQFRG